MNIVLYISNAISITILGTFITSKECKTSAIGVVKPKNPKHEKHAKILKKV